VWLTTLWPRSSKQVRSCWWPGTLFLAKVKPSETLAPCWRQLAKLQASKFLEQVQIDRGRPVDGCFRNEVV